ncbi:MAG: prepilin-type N-terminal cleavage/methylation domain-containing protein [Candidatus Pacebacteria bacterium]|nr:prepilin-type N-terminal cleavage/methylation domain-containing protein [Candidatus Paceibacterota bacterium]
MKKRQKQKKIILSRGFSLVELLVTISILTVVSGVVLFNHARFNNNVLIENLSYEISLTIRQAQFFGWQVKEAGGGFGEGYGAHFDSNSDEFLIFADTYPAAPNQIYDAGYDEIVDRFRMTNNNEINELCFESTCDASTLDISFIRPNPNAFIRENGGGIDRETAEIRVISPKGLVKKIMVNKVGQIAVQEI